MHSLPFTEINKSEITKGFIFSVYRPPNCMVSAEVHVGSRLNYLSSETTKSLKCGEESNPWELKAKPGQKINMTFIDFNWKVRSRSDASENCPVRYGYIVDVETNDIVHLCGDLTRERHLYTSKGHYVQVLIHKDVLDKDNFLIGFKGEYSFFFLFRHFSACSVLNF